MINQEVIFPYLTADELLSMYPVIPKRYVIDFHPRNVNESSIYKSLFKHIKSNILATREAVAKN